MPSFSLVTLAAFALLFSACSPPLCPRNMVQHGHTCSLCPEGSEKKMNQCFKIDGGMEVDAVEADEDAKVDDADAAVDTNLDPSSPLDASTSPVDAASMDATGDTTGAPAMREFALGTAGSACSTELGQTLACEGHASRKILKCQGGTWQVLQTCGPSERCDSRVGTEQGTCATIPAACVGKSAGEICDGLVRLECGVDLVSVTTRACPEHTHCDSTSGTRCICDTGFGDDGQGGCRNPDDCPAGACAGGTCIDGLSDYSCNCNSGYAGTGTKKCTAVLYCPKDACTPGGTCVDTMNWSCQCSTGFTGTGSQACTNQNDCPGNRCIAPNGTCQDQIGTYQCNCNAGFSGADCVNDICSPNPCKNGGTCSRTGMLCTCPTGFSGTNCQTDVCNPNPCLHGGVCSRGATASCSCAGTGYQGANCEALVDPCSGTTNACGGSCMTQLAHQPGENCSNGLLGACARTGKYVCQGTAATVCNAPSIAAGTEICDGVDNDCDGSMDEADATDARTWYPDCDNDGYARVDAVGIRSCTRPTLQAGCKNWTATTPVVSSTADCNDSSAWYAPNAAFGVPNDGSTSSDLNCDGVVEKENGIGQTNIDNVSVSSVPLCPLSDDCQTCAQRSTFGGARWLNNGTPTPTQPRCSTSPSDGFPNQRSYYAFNPSGASCSGSNTWQDFVGGGLQLCR